MIFLELMDLSLGLGALRAPKMTPYPLNVQMFDCNLNLLQLMVQICCALDMILLYLSAIISLELMARFRGLWGPQKNPMSPRCANISDCSFNLLYLSCLWSYWALV